MEYKLNYEEAIANRGNLYRMKQLMKRAERGEKLCIGFIGGSITMGSLATAPELCYAYHVYQWWCNTFPQSEFTYLNAGIGATNSQFGCARAEEHLLKKKPDLVIIEFSVNDESTEHFMETYEGLVRKVYASETEPAVMLVHNVYYDTGANAQVMHGKIGRHYKLPAVSMQSGIFPEVVSGRIENREITPDDLHPNDAGHELVASVITYYLNKIRQDLDHEEEPAPELPAPLTKNGYEDSMIYQNGNSSPQGDGFWADDEPQNGITDIFKNGWMASEKGASLTFELEGSGFSVQYRKSIKKPAPVAVVTVDNDPEKTVILDANFEEDWGDKMELATITEHMPFGKHTVTVTITETHEEDAVPFYLVSVIAVR